MKIYILILTTLFTILMQASEISIIGAGLSGLTCAHRLKQKGHSVDIYEALNRPGGRVLTYYSGNSYEELGGKFLSDGGPAVHITALIQELGLEVFACLIPHTKNYIDAGKSISYYRLHETLPPADQQTWQELKAVADASKHLGEVLDWLCEGQPLLRHLMELRTRNYEGVPSSQLSANYFELFWRYYKLSMNNLALEREGKQHSYDVSSIKGGNSSLIHALCRTIGDDCIHYQMPIKGVELQNEGKLLLQFDNGEQKITDYLILTIPLPLLKEIEIDEKLLPLDQRAVLNNLPFGSNSKIIFPITVNSPIELQFSYTKEAISWFNDDQTFMTLYFGGETAQFCSDEESLREVYHRELPFLKLHYPQIQFPSEDKIIGISWPKERYFQGSYSHFGIPLYEALQEIIHVEEVPLRKVFAPLQNAIFFAGEATALDFPSTMEGAVESADRISMLVHKVASRQTAL